MLQFEILLLVSLVLMGVLVARKRVADALLVVLWAHFALSSARHIPLFVVVSAPLAAAEISQLWEGWISRRSPRSVGRVLWTMGSDLGPSFRRFSIWAPVLAVAVMLLTPAARWPVDFPDPSFPTALVRSESSRLAGARVFTSDQWGDYLIYRGWPRQKVFVDGRSDFYGPSIGEDYVRLMHGRRGWENVFRKYGFDVALVPVDWPLASLLDKDLGWTRVREDKVGVIYQRLD